MITTEFESYNRLWTFVRQSKKGEHGARSTKNHPQIRRPLLNLNPYEIRRTLPNLNLKKIDGIRQTLPNLNP